ncbi:MULTISPECIES: peptide IlvX [Citrobacter]|nr:peptide IlvX [Citrobacter sp. R56]
MNNSIKFCFSKFMAGK